MSGYEVRGTPQQILKIELQPEITGGRGGPVEGQQIFTSLRAPARSRATEPKRQRPDPDMPSLGEAVSAQYGERLGAGSHVSSFLADRKVAALPAWPLFRQLDLAPEKSRLARPGRMVLMVARRQLRKQRFYDVFIAGLFR